jgi:cytochrome c biogenesis protein CcmG, thiol:disulfide interchange protein DsbE
VRRRLLPILATLAGAALVGLLVYGVTATSASRTLDEQVAQGQQPLAPRAATPLPVLGGHGKSSLASLRGRVVVLNFWASWCEPCKSEAPVLERDWTSYRNRGVVFLGVDYHDLASDARRFVSAHALTFTMLKDGSGKVTGSYGISQVPETYVLDRQGRVVAHLAGPITDPGFSGKFRSAIAKAVA